MKQYLIVYILVFICMKGVLLQSNETSPVSNSTGESDPTAASANATTPVVKNDTLVTSSTPAPTSPETPPLASSTPVPVPVRSTTLPSTESSPPPPPSPEETPGTPIKISSHQFHAPSFIGGIVLALGLMAISYVGFKYYKSRTGRNYHTLQENLHM